MRYIVFATIVAAVFVVMGMHGSGQESAAASVSKTVQDFGRVVIVGHRNET